nr:uncharacterized protein LOC107418549 [Ziziphus jujuba var. spinosa]
MQRKDKKELQYDLKDLQDLVTVVRYPLGGDTISVTKGVVSRIEVTSYTHGSSNLLGTQIDATINPEKENLCLYGFPNETWEVNLPIEEVPPELLELALSTNHARNGMYKKDWLSLVANAIVKQIFILEQVIPFRCYFTCNSRIECPIHTENYLYCESNHTLSFIYLSFVG